MKIKKLLASLLVLCLVLSSASYLAKAETVVDAHGNEVELDETLKAQSKVKLKGADDIARKRETNLGDLWTDALLWFAESGRINEYFEEDDIAVGNTGIDESVAGIVALWNGGNLKADINKGSFGSEELMAVLPYPNKVAVVYMTGKQLTEALEAAAQGLPYTEDTAATCASFMQIAGAKYTVKVNVPYDGGEEYGSAWKKANSVKRVKVTTLDGKKIKAKAKYAVITSNANFNGMDSSYMFKAAAEKNERSTITTAVVRDVVWMYIDEVLGGKVTKTYAKAQGRIKLVK